MKSYRELKQLIDSKYNQATSIRDMRFYLLSLLALESGARASDLLRLSFSNIDTDNLIVSYRNSKSKKYQQQCISNTLAKYITTYKECIDNIDSTDKIFYNEYKRTVMSRVTANRRTQKEFNLNFHELRKYAANNIANQKGVVMASKFLGHSRVSTTDIYLGVSNDTYLRHMKDVII